MGRKQLIVQAVLGALLGARLLHAQPPLVEIIRTPPFEDRAKSESVAPALEWAKLNYHLYRRYQYPAARRQLDYAIQIAAAELQALDRHITEYQSISRPVASQPFLVTLDSALLRRQRIAVYVAELRRMRIAQRSTFVTEQLMRQRQVLQSTP